MLVSRVLSVLSPTFEVQDLPGFGLTGEIAEKHTGSFGYPSQIQSDQQRSQTRVSTGSAFPSRSEVKEEKVLVQLSCCTGKPT